MNLKANATAEITKFKTSLKPTDTHLKDRLSAIPLTFPITKYPSIAEKNIIGYAPIGTFIQKQNQKRQGAWTGLKIFFSNDSLGTCEYSTLDLKSAHGAVQLCQETVEYLVNKKPTAKITEGSHDSGYLYEVSWFEPTRMQQLSCATLDFRKDGMSKLLKLANAIDNDRSNHQA